MANEIAATLNRGDGVYQPLVLIRGELLDA